MDASPLEAHRPIPITCPKCGADGTFKRVTTVRNNPFALLMAVRCAGCTHEWEVTTAIPDRWSIQE